MRTFLKSLVACLILTGCSSTPPSMSTYLLRSSNHVGTGELQQKRNVCLGSVTVADYIDQRGLILEQADGTIHVARYHKWAEPLRVSLRGYLATEVSNELGYLVVDSKRQAGTAEEVIDISIDELHADADGNAVLKAHWRVRSEDQDRRFQFSEMTPLRGEGYEVLVAEYERLLNYLAQTIASEI